MKAHVLAAALDGRVIGAADAEISRAVHPAEASCEGDIAIAVSSDTIRILGESRAKIALVPEGTQFPHQRFQTVIFMRGSRFSLPEITHVGSEEAMGQAAGGWHHRRRMKTDGCAP